MKKLKSNPLFKLLLALLIPVSIFSLVFCSVSAVLLSATGYLGPDASPSTFYQFRQLLKNRQADAWEYLYLSDAQAGDSYLEQRQYEESLARLEQALAPEQTNFRYEIRTFDGQLLQSNRSNGEDWTALGYTTALWDGLSFQSQSSPVFYDDSGTDSGTPSPSPSPSPADAEPGWETLILEFGLTPELSAADDLQSFLLQLEHRQAAFPWLVAGAVVSALLLLTCLCLLLTCAGHSRSSQGMSLTWFDRLWFDLLLLVYLLAWFLLFQAFYEFWSYSLGWLSDQERHLTILLLLSGTAAALTTALLPLLYTFAVRCKSHTLLRGTLLHLLWERLMGLLRRLSRLFHALRMSWRLVMGFAAYELLTLFVVAAWGMQSGPCFLLTLVLNLLILAALCLWAEAFRRVRQGGKALADGDLSFRIDADRLPPDLRAHAEDLNNISRGMTAAVEKQMQSERFKAELITNVSHDLKTPLTSIINYVDLLKKEDISNPTAAEYIQVLDRKSQRLKKLTEDLVEASKASTGALNVERSRLGMAQLVSQAVAEYEEKLAAHQLAVVTSLPEEEVYVSADGRHLWRILDNLLSNCAKYALPGTRVYVDVAGQENEVLLAVKNVSREPLNIPAERLMERFVRGDESRTTEGSGLGLSIARSLAELQGGRFRLTVDGDLFKATLSLPRIP